MYRKLSIFWFLSFTICLSKQQTPDTFKAAREGHRARQLTDAQLRNIVALGKSTQFRTILNPILVPRVVGTPGHENVKQYLVNYMQPLGWHVENDIFTSRTPVGDRQFSNIVARLNPNATRFLAIGCHYDSKLMKNFVGATDSAVPCAMMLHLASSLAEPLKDLTSQNNDVSLKFIFFDGEEAFHEWGPDDSIYGAKHLASILESTPYPANSKSGTNHLNRMDMLVLLDLIGVANPKFYSYFRNTQQWHLLLASAEKRLAAQGLLARRSRNKYFYEISSFSFTEDDHIPFLERGVPILHVIPNPFPSVWHTPQDNLSALDFNTIDDLNTILRVFVAEYLKLNI